MILTGLLLAVLGLLASAQEESPCPPSWQSYHVQYLNARLQENVELEADLYLYQLHGNIPEDGYQADQSYGLRLRVNAAGEHTPIRGFVVVATPLDGAESECGFGRFDDVTSGVRKRPGCPHVLMNDGFEDKLHVGFHWTAPSCGCVKIRATIITDANAFFSDADDDTSGPLTRTICPFNHVLPADADDDEDDGVLDLLDLEYFGLEEDEEEEDEETLSALEVLLLEAVGVDAELIDVSVEDDDDVDDDDDDYSIDEDEDEEEEDDDEDEDSSRGLGGNWKGGARGKMLRWKKKMQRRRQQNRDEDASDSSEEEREGRRNHHHRRPNHRAMGRHHPARAETVDDDIDDDGDDVHHRRGRRQGAHKGHGVGGRRRRYHMRQMSPEEKVEHVCSRINAPRPQHHRHQDRQTNDTASEARRQMHEERREQLQACCAMEDMENKMECFEELKEERFDRICSGQETMRPHRRMRRRGGRAEEETEERPRPEWMQQCCEQTDEERYACFNESVRESKLEGRQKRMATIQQRLARMSNPEHRTDAVCRKVQQPSPPRRRLLSQMGEDDVSRWQQIWDTRREEMRECCEVEDSTEKDECMQDIRDRRYERVCHGEEPLRLPNKKARSRQAEAVESCCEAEEEERLECIRGLIGHRFGGRWRHRVKKLTQKLERFGGNSTDDTATRGRQRGVFRRRMERRQEVPNVEVVREEVALQDDLQIIHHSDPAQTVDESVESVEEEDDDDDDDDEDEDADHPRRRTRVRCCLAGRREGRESGHSRGTCVREAKKLAKEVPHFKFACKQSFTRCCVHERGDSEEEDVARVRRPAKQRRTPQHHVTRERGNR